MPNTECYEECYEEYNEVKPLAALSRKVALSRPTVEPNL
jgi:hypothetical protein